MTIYLHSDGSEASKPAVLTAFDAWLGAAFGDVLGEPVEPDHVPAPRLVTVPPSITVSCRDYHAHQLRHVVRDGRGLCLACDPAPG